MIHCTSPPPHTNSTVLILVTQAHHYYSPFKVPLESATYTDDKPLGKLQQIGSSLQPWPSLQSLTRCRLDLVLQPCL